MLTPDFKGQTFPEMELGRLWEATLLASASSMIAKCKPRASSSGLKKFMPVRVAV
jgi:hypothetical protein